jgi:hypothetical protein
VAGSEIRLLPRGFAVFSPVAGHRGGNHRVRYKEEDVAELNQQEQQDWRAIASALQKEKDHQKISELAAKLDEALTPACQRSQFGR